MPSHRAVSAVEVSKEQVGRHKMSGYRVNSDTLGMSVTLGESFRTSNCSTPISPTRTSIPSLTDVPLIWKTKLPPAVANVPPDHIRGYLHHKKVNHYLIGQKLGEGSFAKVKEAFHVLVGEKVAMKVIDKKKAQQDPYVAKNFRREARLLQMVRHPNILQLLEVIETDGSFYLITELCSGGELMKYIYKKGRLDENETRKFMRHIVSAVDHLHKAGVIHRDLKVENLLLDANMDIKLIDFGLSNEEYVQGENGMAHCNTQCGSPAYAAPELLGHKPYGPQVDIWSIGVNMYAMLTGCLPYTVEPFNITALHAKMLENKMNPIPEHLSKNCKDLLRNLLRSNPDERLKMPEIMMHPWMNEGHALPFGPAPFPNRLDFLDLDDDIVQHMVYILKIRESEEELKQELLSNRATQGAAIYHLLIARLARYKKQFKRSSNMRPRHSRVSRDQGFFEDENEDVKSIVSMPTTQRQSRPSKRHPGRTPHMAEPPKEQPTQNPSLIEVDGGEDNDEEVCSPAGFNRHRRRSTMPEMMLKDDIEALREKMRKREEGPRIKKPAAFPSQTEAINRKDEHIDGSRFDSSRKNLVPIDQSGGKLRRNHYSTPSRLNEVREQLTTHLPRQSPMKEAWRSNPVSRTASRQPSRHSSRHPSGVTRPNNTTSTSSHSRAASYDEQARDHEEEELTFHDVSSQTLPRSHRFRSQTVSESPSSTLPSIINPQGTQTSERLHGRSRAHSESFKNGYTLPNGVDLKPVELSGALNEIEKAAYGLKLRDVERRGYNSVICTWNGIKIQVFVNKEQDKYKVSYSWLSGGTMKSFIEKRDKLAKRIKL